MKRNLIRQMRNEWRENIWLIIGLMIVSLAIWWLTVLFYDRTNGLYYKKGFDVTDVYSIRIGKLPNDSPDYVEREDAERAFLDSQDLRILIAAIRNSPYVEAAAFSQNGLPYSMSYYGNTLFMKTTPEDTLGYPFNLRMVSPDMVRVLRVKSRTGKDEEYLEKVLQDGGLLISNIFKSWSRRVPEELNGQSVYVGGDTVTLYKVGDIVDQIRRSDYDLTSGGMALFPINEDDVIRADMIGIRMKPGMGEKFREQFEIDPAMQAHGNHFLTRLTKMTDQAKSVQKNQSTNARMRFTLIVFLLIIVGLGMLGIFWFRIQQRIGEIAIRKVCGAKSSDIFKRIITEGLILLFFASLLTAAVGWPLLHISWLQEEFTNVKTIIYMEFVTFVIVALGITLSLWWPARRAMRIEPAIAIKDE